MDNLEDLIDLAKQANRAYREGKPFLSDTGYDDLLDKIELLDPDNDILKDTGSDEVISIDRKIILPIQMHSFEKVYKNDTKGDQVSSFLNDGKHKVGSYKLDGAALLLEYNKGKLIQAFTKGRNNIGQKSLMHAEAIKNIPKEIGLDIHLFVKTELIIYKSVFLKKYSNKFKNSRNLVAGLLNSKTVSPIFDDVVAVAHSLEFLYSPNTGTLKKLGYTNKSIQWDLLKNMGFTVVNNFKINNKMTVDVLEKLLLDYKNNNDILCDGIVIEYSETEDREAVGYLPNTNPKFGVAYKVQTDKAITNITDIEWNVSKQGYLIPRITYNPVILNGTTCTHVTGKNAKYIKDNNVYIGVEITLHKGGDIIPDITNVNQKMSAIGKINNLPDKCPICGNSVIWNSTFVHLMCINNSCGAQLSQKILHFFKTLDIPNVAEATIDKIIEVKNFTKISDFFGLEDDTFIMDGIGKRSSFNINNGLKSKLHNVDLAILMYASGLFDGSIGSTKIQWVIDKFGDIIFNPITKKDVLTIHGFADKTAKVFIDSLNKFKIWYESNKTFIKYNIKQKNIGNKLSGRIFVFTGFRDKELEKEIENEGGIIGASVTSKTTDLIVKSLNDTSSKLEKAKKLNIKIIDKENFKIK